MSLPPSQPDGAEPGSAFFRSPSARRIPWDVLAVIAGSLLFLTLFYRFPISDPDEGIIATGAERILRGEIPFRDFFSELGPASFYLQAMIFRIIGESLTAIRVTAWGLGGILTGIVYLLAKRLVSGAGALIPAAAFAFPFLPTPPLAFSLAMLHVLLHEIGVYDEPFLKRRTNAVYLIGKDGYYLKDDATGKPVIWDPVAGRPKPFDDPTIKDYALEGRYRVGNVDGTVAFQLVKEHVKPYTPEWAAMITTVPASTIRRIS
ncbi:MAG: hypothetical protein LAO07_02290, partial [Acidobacteriia bacterium]|nr:hypothetical protein [Terriglobia bacterium]